MTVRVARCHCGAAQIACGGEPRKVSLCHCTQCQRRTGSAFSVAVFFERGLARASGKTRVFERPSASGCSVAFHFCPTCGTTLWWEPRRLPDLVGVAIGGFADPGFPGPVQAVWGKEKQAWLDDLPRLPLFDENPPGRPAG